MSKRTDNQLLTSEQLMAGVITLVVVLLLLLLLLVVKIGTHGVDNRVETETVQLAAVDPDEEFLDAILEEEGVETDEASKTADALPLGEPDESAQPTNKSVTNGPEITPNNSNEHLATQKTPSAVQATTPSKKEQPDSRISADMKNKFSAHNGLPDDSRSNSSGSGGTSTGSAQGSVRGRDFLGCTPPKVRLKEPLTVVIDVVVDENGRVITATYRSGTSDAAVRAACVAATRKAKWSAKKGATRTPGTLTWNLRPKV